MVQRHAQRVVNASCHFWVAPHAPRAETSLARSGLAILDRKAVVFHAQRHRRIPFAVITAPSPATVLCAMQRGAAFGNATGTFESGRPDWNECGASKGGQER